MIDFKTYLEEVKRGLWANIHAKRKRIKAGSGEKMRKPGSKGAPSEADLKAANEEVQIDEIVVALAPIDVRNPKKPEQQKLDLDKISTPAKPPSTEKRGVKGRPGQRPMPTYEELSADEQFDLIEEVVEELAKENGIDSEAIWETLESVDDVELFEYAIDKKGHKSSTGGLTQKGVDAYNAKTGGNLKTAVTTPPSKLKPGSKAANRRKSFCARMGGVEGPMKDDKGRPTRKALALRKWNC